MGLDEARDLVARLVHEPEELIEVVGGHSEGRRFLVDLGGDERAFLKVAAGDDAVRGYALERDIYRDLQGPYHPRLLAFDDDAHALLLEDLSRAHAPPPYHPDHVKALLRALAAIRTARPRSAWGLPQLPGPAEREASWETIGQDPAAFLALGRVDRAWFDASVARLVDAERRVDLRGHKIVHGDVYGDNTRVVGRRGVFLDWGEAAIGNAQVDLAALWWDIQLSDGPHELVRIEDPGGWAALLSGTMAYAATLPAEGRAARMRERQRRELAWALRLAARWCDLPDPDG